MSLHIASSLTQSPNNTSKSPTASMSDSVASPSVPSVLSSTSVEKILMVTADSDRYAKVDISAARTAAQIRELILSKVGPHLCEKECQDN